MLRKFLRRIAGVAGVGFLALNMLAAEPAAEIETLMTERGKLLFSDPFTQPLGNEWKVGIGKWEVVDGVLQGSEQKADKHSAVLRHAMPFQNVVIQCSFKLDGAQQTTFSIDAKGHCCRAIINPTSLAVRKDLNADGAAMVLDRRETALTPGKWHTIVIELLGKEILARLDGDDVALGSHESIDVKKTSLFLTASGASASFKDVRVWEASPSKSWEATRAKVLESRRRAQNGGK